MRAKVVEYKLLTDIYQWDVVSSLSERYRCNGDGGGAIVIVIIIYDSLLSSLIIAPHDRTR